jgi:hypothetical protein
MLIINFTRPLTEQHLLGIAHACGSNRDALVERLIRTSFIEDSQYPVQATKLIDRVNLSRKEWQHENILIVLPGHPSAAALLLAELHGRMGYFPPIVRIREGNLPGTWVFAEILDLRAQRNGAANEAR